MDSVKKAQKSRLCMFKPMRYFFGMGLLIWVSGVSGGVEHARAADSSHLKTQKKSSPDAQPPSSLVIYTSRAENLIRPVIDLYESQSGVQVKFQTGSAGLFIEKLKAQKKQVQADIFMTVDAGNLWAAKQSGLLAPMKTDFIDPSVPAAYRDADGYWFGVSLRVRSIIYNPTLTSPSQLSTYEDLSDPKWKGKLCLRTAKKVYNQSLVAMLIHHHGLEKTTKIVKGWVSNLARQVFSNDTHLIEAIAAGQCVVGVANSYYLGRLQKKNPQLAAQIFWANHSTTGVHVNVSGVGVLKYAKNLDTARDFVRFLFTPKAQEIFSQLNYEFPVIKNAALDPIVAAWGIFKPSKMPLSEAGRLQQASIKIMDSAGYR